MKANAKAELKTFFCPSHPKELIRKVRFSDHNVAMPGLACIECIMGMKSQEHETLMNVEEYIHRLGHHFELAKDHVIDTKQLPNGAQELLVSENEMLSSLSIHIELQKSKVSRSFEILKQNVTERIDAQRDALLCQLDEQLKSLEMRFSVFKSKVQRHEKQTEVRTVELLTKQVNELQSALDFQILLGSLTDEKAENKKLCSLSKEEASSIALDRVKQMVGELSKSKEVKPYTAYSHPSTFDGVQRKWTKQVETLVSSLGLDITNSISEWRGLAGLFSDSMILLRNREANLLKYWLPAEKASGSLLYRGSRDGFSAVDFHRACDGKGQNVVIVEILNGTKFGGYCSVS